VHCSCRCTVEYSLCSLCCISGIAYVTFSKASEAALAIEKMNGSLMKDHTRPLKVSVVELVIRLS